MIDAIITRNIYKRHQVVAIDTRFKKVFLEVDNLEKKIQNKEWSRVFPDKNYTFENLMKSQNYYNIYNFTRIIGDDLTLLCKQEKVSDDEVKLYQKQRYHLDNELHRLNLLIEEQDRIFWESTKEILEQFAHTIMLNLPQDLNSNIWAGIVRFFTRLKSKKPDYLKE
jgi:uncharacterized protein YdcH (DUF465 family)